MLNINLRAAADTTTGASSAFKSIRVYKRGNVAPATQRLSSLAAGELTLCEAYRGVRFGFGIKPRMQYAAVWAVAGVLSAAWAIYPGSALLLRRITNPNEEDA